MNRYTSTIVHLTILSLAFFSGITVFSQEQNQETITANESTLFSRFAIQNARNTVKMGGWTPEVIAAQYNNPSNAEDLWIASLQAALFESPQTFGQTIATFDRLLPSVTGSASLAWPDAIRVLQSYECLRAIPAWGTYNPETKDSLNKQIVAFVQARIPQNPQNQNKQDQIQQQAFALLGSTMINHATNIPVILGDHDNKDGLISYLESYATGEGLLGSSINEHLRLSNHLFLAGLAVKSATADGYQQLQPWLKRAYTIITELTYPNGAFPAVLHQENFDNARYRELLERAYVLFADTRCATILSNLYKNTTRKGEALLYGSADLPTLIYPTKTSAFPQSGAVWLRSQEAPFPLSVFVDTGISRYGQQSGLLSIEVSSSDTVLTGVSTQNNSKIYNTVLLDGKPSPQPKSGQSANGFVYSLRKSNKGTFVDPRFDRTQINPNKPMLTYMNVTAEGTYTERKAYENADIYQRSLFLASPLLVDLFRVRGGKSHEYRYHFNGRVKQIDGIDSTALGENLQAQGIYSVLFSPGKGSTHGERIWFLDPAGSTLTVQENQGVSSIHCSRTSEDGEADLFAVVHEYYEGDAPQSSVTRLPLFPAGNRRDFQAVGIAVEQGKRTDLFFSSTNNETEYTVDYQGKKIAFQGAWGHIRLYENAFQAMRLGGGTKLQYDVFSVEPELPLLNGVLRSIEPDTGNAVLDFGHPLPVEGMASTHSVMAITNYPATVMYQPLFIDSIHPFTTPQQTALHNCPTVKFTKPELGFPVQSGTALFYESYTELQRLARNDFSLVVTSPTAFTVPGSEDARRMVYKHARGRFIEVGDLETDRLRARVLPSDAIMGEISLKRFEGFARNSQQKTQ
jgi:hypothetical protein